jgi:hypothetical protein
VQLLMSQDTIARSVRLAEGCVTHPFTSLYIDLRILSFHQQPNYLLHNYLLSDTQ